MAIIVHRAKPLSELRCGHSGAHIIKTREGFVGYAYWDKHPGRPATFADMQSVTADLDPMDVDGARKRVKEAFGVLTIGYGFTDGVQIGDTMTRGEADARFASEVIRYEDTVRRQITRNLTQGQFDALVSLVFARGHVPPSLRAAINGGQTDAGVTVGPDDWDEARVQFLRNCWWSGKPVESLYRFRMWEILLTLGFDGGTAVRACGAVKMVTRKTEGGKLAIDVEKSTSIDEVVERAARLSAVPPGAPQPYPARMPQAEEQPPAVVAPDPGDINLPEPETVAAPVIEIEEPAPAPAPKPKPAPPVVAPVGTKRASPNTLPAEQVPYGVDPAKGAKPLDETERGRGYFWQQFGLFWIKIGSLGVFGTGAKAAADAIAGDPVLMSIILATLACVGTAGVGYVVKVYGDWRRARGERDATQLMY